METIQVEDLYFVCETMPGGPPVFKGWAEVKGKALEIPGFEVLDLFIHRPLDRWDGQFQKWIISEGQTGGGCAAGKTQKAAVQDFICRCERTKVTAESMARDVQAMIARIGLSPRYRGEWTRIVWR